jgi:N-acetylneuraminic acid mutarotase
MEARARNSCHTRFVLVAAVLTGLVAAAATAAGQGDDRPGWSLRSPLPLPRSEVASAVLRGKIAVAGGFLSDGSSSRRVDLYDPALDRWARLPDLPIGVNHAMAAADGRRIYVVGGYADARALRRGFVLEGGVWKPLPLLPEARAAGGAAVVGGRLYVVGGVFAQGRLARDAYVLDRARRRWTAIAGPSPREHLGVAALNGRIYAVGGRSAGFDTNLDLTEVFSEGRWQTVAAVPGKRGGTGLGAGRGLLVSAGGEATGGTIPEVYALDPKAGEWRSLPDLPTPRHGLAVEVVGGRVYAIGGGPEPGLTVSGANESLQLP